MRRDKPRIGRPPTTIQYKEGSREEFGWLRVIHLDDLLSIETQLSISEGAVLYGMRLGWKRGLPPLTGELISLHMPQSRMLVRVSRVMRTCVCCTRGAVYVHVEPSPGIVPDTSKICHCSKKRNQKTVKDWRNYDEEVACSQKGRAVLRNVSEILGGDKK